MPEPLLIFPHLYSTGGTTFRRILMRQYGEDAVLRVSIPGQDSREIYREIRALSPERLASARVLTAHVGAGVESLFDRPCRSVTFLREPVSRIESLYDQALLKGEISLPEFDNGQTRMLCGIEHVDDAVPFGKCSRGMLEDAKSNLRERFAVTGLTDRFDESVLLMQRKFGWRRPLHARENRRQNPVPPDRYPAAVLDRVRKHNELDAELYEFARELFEEAIARAGSEFDAELRSFRRWNGPYSLAYDLLRPVYRAILPSS